MATIIRMPEVLANATEAVVSTWVAAEGAAVSVGDLLAEIETEKAVVELAAEEAGVLGRHLAAPGERVEVGAPIALLLASADEQVDLAALLGHEADLASQAEQPTDAPGRVAATAEAADGGTRPTATGVAAAGAPTPPAPVGRPLISPLARRMAREAGVDLAGAAGSGPGGRIVRRDIERLLAARPSTDQGPTTAPTPAAGSGGAAPARPAAATRAGYEEIPHSSMRRAIARRLAESKATVPHFYLVAECRVDALLALRAEVNAAGGVRISVNDLVLKAVAVAYRTVPEANVMWTDAALRRFGTVDVAVAVSTDTGLLTPVVRGVEGLSVGELNRTVVDLAERARAGRLRQDELEGGTVTVSNLGMYGTREFSAILNPPQAMIVAVGAAVQQPVVVDGELAVGTVMRCTVSADHRAVDGALAARWLAAFQQALEHPLTLLV